MALVGWRSTNTKAPSSSLRTKPQRVRFMTIMPNAISLKRDRAVICCRPFRAHTT